MNETRTCENCGQACGDLTEFDGLLLCESCFGGLTTICDHCGQRIWNDNNAGDSSTNVCERCYDRYYTTCAECGRVMYDSDGYFNEYEELVCYDCHRNHKHDHSINSYSYKPDPIFYGGGDRYFGVELEIDDAGEDDDNAEEVLDVANVRGEHIYCKRDGSLNEGFEIVTHPMTLTYHMENMPWNDVLSTAKSLGYRSHQTHTCGLHIHVNRTAFGETEESREACIAWILYFFEKHWDELLKFSRRTEGQLIQWACRYGYKDQPMDILKQAKTGNSGCRYMCVNLTNEDTIEFRIFRGSLKLNTVFAALQLVDRICDAAISLSDDDIKAMSWTTFVADCKQTELIQYLKERRLYINEPVDVEVEI